MELMTRQEVADYLKVSLRTVDNIIKDRDFKAAIHIGRNVRIIKSRLNDYINRKTI